MLIPNLQLDLNSNIWFPLNWYELILEGKNMMYPQIYIFKCLENSKNRQICFFSVYFYEREKMKPHFSRKIFYSVFSLSRIFLKKFNFWKKKLTRHVKKEMTSNFFIKYLKYILKLNFVFSSFNENKVFFSV